jgi:surface antigen
MTVLISLFLALCLAGCDSVTKQDVGVVTGGALGGLLGSQFGHGSGRVLAAVGGTVLGAVIGGAIGKSMDKVDRMEMNKAFETAPTNQPQSWRNPDSGNSYTVTPTRTFYRNDQPCREYTSSAIIGGKKQQIYGKACRMSDGSWQVVSDN